MRERAIQTSGSVHHFRDGVYTDATLLKHSSGLTQSLTRSHPEIAAARRRGRAIARHCSIVCPIAPLAGNHDGAALPPMLSGFLDLRPLNLPHGNGLKRRGLHVLLTQEDANIPCEIVDTELGLCSRLWSRFVQRSRV